jgi:hypothetical protein
MSQALMTLIVSHLLTFVESELIKSEPKIVAAVTQDVQSLIAKLEKLIADKAGSYNVKPAPAITGIANNMKSGMGEPIPAVNG